MRLPLFQKIEIETDNVEALKAIFSKNSVSGCPTILLFNHLKGISLADAVAACQKAYQERQLNPLMPYPTYIVSDLALNQHYFPEVRSIKEAPKHFLKKIKKVKKREQTLLTKATTFSERIQNHNLVDDLKYLKAKARDNKGLKKLCCEKNFYLNLLEKVKNPQS